jgi:hypothetical protein
VEEFFLHAWDELDDFVGLARHLSTWTADEALAAAVPLIATASAALLGGSVVLLLSHYRFAAFLT